MMLRAEGCGGALGGYEAVRLLRRATLSCSKPYARSQAVDFVELGLLDG